MTTRRAKQKKTMAPVAYQVPPGHVLVMRTCKPDMTSYGGFVWPTSGHVECSDWTATPECGHGLHGFLWGEGDGSLANWDSDAVWLVVEVNAGCVVEIPTGKVKFQSGTVVHCGTRETATIFVREHATGARSIVGGTSTSGDGGTSTSGYGGTSTSGVRGTSTSGDGGTSTSGVRGTSTSGYGGTSTSGYGGTSTSGDGGTSTSGDGGTSTSGVGGTSTSGVRGTSTSGYGGTSTSGDGGTSTSGVGGTSTSGDGGTSTSGDGGTSTSGVRGTSTSGDRGTSKTGSVGIVVCRWWDETRYRLTVGYVGEDGIKPDTFYKCDSNGKLTEVIK